jgi:hypothetical protein
MHILNKAWDRMQLTFYGEIFKTNEGLSHMTSSMIGHTWEEMKSEHLTLSYCNAEIISTHYRHRFDFGDAVLKVEVSVENKWVRRDNGHQLNKFMQNIMFHSSWLET